MQAPFQRLLVLLDYDGTVTARDSNEIVLQRFTGDAWRRHEEALHRGRIGHAECLRRQIGLLRLPRGELINEMVAAAQPAPGLAPFLAQITAGGARVVVVSAGFREAIETFWRREGLPAVDVIAGELVGDEPPFDVALHPTLGDCPVCGRGACKGEVARSLSDGRVVAVFGDGHSDLCMAREADAVFARPPLSGLCAAEGLRAEPLRDFSVALETLRRDGLRRAMEPQP